MRRWSATAVAAPGGRAGGGGWRSFRCGAPARLGRFSPPEFGAAGAEPLRNDPFRFDRFVAMHHVYWPRALAEIEKGRRRTCWPELLLPNPPHLVYGDAGVAEHGRPKSRDYCLRDPPPNEMGGFAAARAYLAFPPTADGVHLRARYLELVRLIDARCNDPPPAGGVGLMRLLGPVDGRKYINSLELFAKASDGFDGEVHALCAAALRRAYSNNDAPLSSSFVDEVVT